MHQLSMSESIVTAVQSLLLPQGGGCCPLTQHLVLQGDGNALVNQICRVVAEVRTRYSGCYYFTVKCRYVRFYS